MPVELQHMREILLPGLRDLQYLQYSFTLTKEVWAANILNGPAAPYIWIPRLTIPQALVVGAAATIIKNPEITRRFWQGWLSKA